MPALPGCSIASAGAHGVPTTFARQYGLVSLAAGLSLRML